jgi:hypothetical protein
VSLPRQKKIGGIDRKISINVNVTKGCVANTEVLISRTAESLAHKQHKIIKRNNKIINVETEMSRYNEYHMARVYGIASTETLKRECKGDSGIGQHGRWLNVKCETLQQHCDSTHST